MQIFRFPSFRLCPFYPTGINIGSKRPQHVLKHAEKQAETRRVQSFGAKFGASAVLQYFFLQLFYTILKSYICNDIKVRRKNLSRLLYRTCGSVWRIFPHVSNFFPRFSCVHFDEKWSFLVSCVVGMISKWYKTSVKL